MHTIFLSDNQKKKITIFTELFNSQGMTLSEISKEFCISKNKAKKIIDQLNKDFSEIYCPIVIKKKKEHQYFCSQVKQSFPEILNELSYLYTRDYLPFQLCHLLIKHTNVTVFSAASELNISVSYVYRSITKLNKLLQPINIFVNNSSDKVLTFTGKEISIRIFMFHFMAYLLPEHHCSMPGISKINLENDLKKIFSENVRKKINFSNLVSFFLILKQRINKKKYLPNLEGSFPNTLNYYVFLNKKQLEDINFFSNLFWDTEYAKTEFIYLNFLLRIYFPEIISYEDTLNQGKLIENSERLPTKFIKEMIKQWKITFVNRMPLNHYYHLLYQSSLIFNLPIFFDESIQKLWDFYLPVNLKSTYDSNLLLKIVNFLNTYIEEYGDTDFEKPFLSKYQINYLATLLYLQVQMFINPQVNVFLNFGKNIFTKEFVINRMYLVYSPNLINIVNDIRESDLVISDSISFKDTKKPYIFVQEIIDPVLWKNIFTHVQKIITEKYF